MKRFGLALIIGFFVISIINPNCYATEDAAMAIDIQNGKACYESGERKDQEVILMDFLKENDQIKLAPQTTLVLNYFASGVREEITGPGIITIGSTGSKKEDDTVMIKSEKVDYLPPRSAIETGDLQQTGAVVLRGGSGLDKITVLSLANTAVRSIQPVFRWHPVKGSDTYKLRVYDVQDRVCQEITTDKTTFTYSKSDLNQGEQYWWNVLALAEGKIIAKGEGQFAILTGENLKKLLHAEQNIEERYPKESAEAQVTLAMIYQSYELYDEAVDIFRKLHRKYPQNRNIIRHIKMFYSGYTTQQEIH